MSDQRTYEIERRCGDNNTWIFVGNLTVNGYSLGACLEEAAAERGWPDGEYRAVEWHESYGSMYVYALSSKTERIAAPAEWVPRVDEPFSDEDAAATIAVIDEVIPS